METQNEAMKELTREEVETLLREWCKENPYTVYADRNDELPVEYAEKIMDCENDAELENVLCDIECEIDDNLLDYRWQAEDESFKQCLKDNELYFDSKSEEESYLEFFREYFEFNTWEYIQHIFGQSSHIHIVATPQYNGEAIEAPNTFDNSEEYNKELSGILIETLGYSQEDCDKLANETGYSGAVLRVCGTIDFSEIFKTREMPKTITFSKSDSIVFHNAGNGSGSCYEPEITKTVTLPANFRVDNSWKYGIDAVYGMSGRFWQNDLTMTSKEA